MHVTSVEVLLYGLDSSSDTQVSSIGSIMVVPEDQTLYAVVMENYNLINTPPEILKVTQAASVTCMLERDQFCMLQ